ncbi:HYR domain protein [Variovorax boronicumulans]|uniref:Ig-like domain-containing protein n=1 Tax=Variovorax boronicumulans TaxID=436515 RepID=UPI000BB38E93|nr:Ig-like domain-containing protein [Variovorax boronicumulans]PBI92173.1 HYR domain protein [Variovorax boronicumulans]
MATKKTKVVVNSNGRNIDHTVEAAANGKAPVRIKVQKGAKYLLKGDDGFAPENVTLTRVGNDLQITLEGETSPGLVLEGYYAQSEPVGLYGVAEDGQLYAYARTDGAGDIYALAEGQSAPVALGGDSYGPGAPYLAGTEAAGGNDVFGGMLPLLMTGGLAALGLGAIAAASGSDGDTAPSLPPVMPPPDVRPPGKPGFDGIGGAYDDVGPIQGQIQPGGQTDDTRPDFFGTGTPGNTITMYDNGKEIGKTLVDGNGAWHFTPPKDLSEGNHSITITESDPAGREGEPSDPFEFAVDTTPPPKPEWNGGSSEGPGAVIDDVGPIKGRVPPGGATDDQRPDFDGQGTPGDTIIVQDHGEEIGRVEVNGDGVWTFTPPTDLSEGEHSITIVERDPAGNESKPSDPFEFVVDITPPAQPQVGGANDNMGEYQGPITPGGVTDDRQPEFHGEGTPGDTIVIKDGDTVIGTTEVDENGAWTFTPSTDLKEGDHSITVIARDPAGNESKPSDPFDFEIDVTPPDASKLAITGVADDVGEVTGNVASGGKTDDSRPLLSGTGTTGDTIIVTVKDSTGSRELGRAIVEADGKWTLQVSTPLLQGKNEFTAIEMDPTGTVHGGSGNNEFVVSDVKHLADSAISGNGGTDTLKLTGANQLLDLIALGHKVSSVEIIDITGTGNNTLALSLADVMENGAMNQFVTNGRVQMMVKGNAGDKVSLMDVLPNGTDPGDWVKGVNVTVGGVVYEVYQHSGFKADLLVQQGVAVTLQISIDQVMDDAGAITGPIANGGFTDDTTPTLTGKAIAGGTVKIYDGNTLLGQAVVNASGNWSYTPDTPLGEGLHSLRASVTPAGGSESARTAAFDLTVDRTAPTKPTIVSVMDDVGSVVGKVALNGTTDDARPDFSGKAEANSTVFIYDKGVKLTQVLADASGNWSWTPATALGNGVHTITVTAVDKAGNASVASDAFGFTVATTPPAKPTIVSVIDDVEAITGAIASGTTTNDAKPTFSGKADANGTVIIYDKGVEIGRVQANASGNWTYTPAKALGEGAHSITVAGADPTGNTSAQSDAFGFTVDTTPPSFGAIGGAHVSYDSNLGWVYEAMSANNRPRLNAASACAPKAHSFPQAFFGATWQPG